MKIHDLAPNIPRKPRKRRGQGDAAGQGSFSGKGCKGQKARSGGKVRLGFEGGQTPLIQRMPKWKGFRNPRRRENEVVNLSALEENFSAGDIVQLATLKEKKLISKTAKFAKLLGNGELTKKLTVEKDVLVSAAAKESIEKVGGKVSA